MASLDLKRPIAMAGVESFSGMGAAPFQFTTATLLSSYLRDEPLPSAKWRIPCGRACHPLKTPAPSALLPKCQHTNSEACQNSSLRGYRFEIALVELQLLQETGFIEQALFACVAVVLVLADLVFGLGHVLLQPWPHGHAWRQEERESMT